MLQEFQTYDLVRVCKENQHSHEGRDSLRPDF